MHDAALEALVDEVAIGRVVGWALVGAPQICRLRAGQQVLLARPLGNAASQVTVRRERLVEVDRLPLEGVRRRLLRERDDRGVVVRDR